MLPNCLQLLSHVCVAHQCRLSKHMSCLFKRKKFENYVHLISTYKYQIINQTCQIHLKKGRCNKINYKFKIKHLLE